MLTLFCQFGLWAAVGMAGPLVCPVFQFGLWSGPVWLVVDGQAGIGGPAAGRNTFQGVAAYAGPQNTARARVCRASPLRLMPWSIRCWDGKSAISDSNSSGAHPGEAPNRVLTIRRICRPGQKA